MSISAAPGWDASCIKQVGVFLLPLDGMLVALSTLEYFCSSWMHGSSIKESVEIVLLPLDACW